MVLLFIVNSSLENGKFPSRCKVALVKPTIKSKSADPDNLASFRPVSNISFLSKLLEKVGATQFNLHLEGQNLHCPVQSGYRSRHSCETLMIKMMNDILHLIEEKNTVALILLDLSAAFDTIDHTYMLHVTWLGLLTSVSRLSLLHHSRYSVVPSVAITFGHEPAA